VLEQRTDKEWATFFKNLPAYHTIDANSRQLIGQLVNERVSFALQAVCTRPINKFSAIETVLNCTEPLTIQNFAEYCKLAKKNDLTVSLDVYERIRATVNATAESQLEAIQSELCDYSIPLESHVVHRIKQKYGDDIKFYDPFKSEQCIYAWVRKRHLLFHLPPPFDTERVLLEVIKLGNKGVFKFWPHACSHEFYMTVLEINPELIKEIKNQAPEMRDYVLAKNMDLFYALNDNLKTVKICWNALNHNSNLLSHVPADILTDEMVKFALDKYHVDGWSATTRRIVNTCIEKSSTVLWHMIKTRPKYIFNIDDCQCTNDMLDYVSNHYSYEIQRFWFSTMIASKTFIRTDDDLSALVKRCPQLIQECFCYSKRHLTITEEMSVAAMSHNPKDYFCYCAITPKIIKMACDASIDVFTYHYKDTIRAR
jgi:hypothetical protein